ncbi:MAG TPA: Xaa-Pro peptidase family protein [Candidatus Udaeobacter sp.]|jgi:Xaa-Pro aminopeptidase|nr:Xaa-Pro peptidase family protein [Candidatus Udaeobacter sp.]
MMIPQLSLQERDRRYKIVREEMARRSIDCLLLPANSGRWEQLQADSRYLTSIGGFATEVFTVFPLEGEVTAYIFNRAAWWKQAQNWVGDVRDGRNRWSENAIERINELGLQKGTLGIAGLAGLFRAPEGIIPYSSVKAIQDAFPQAKLVNATEMMQTIRAVKSAEEVSFLERSAGIIEKTIDTMAQTARPGVSEKELYGAMVNAMLSNGGELPTLFFLSAGPDISNSSFVPTDYRIQRGDRIINEIEAKYGGYAAQAVSPAVIGKPKEDYSEMIEISRACFDAILADMKPGVTFGLLFDTYRETVEQRGKGRYVWNHPMMHARGLGDDGPALLGNKDLQRFSQTKLETGMVFILKPQVRAAEGKGRASIGDTVAVTENGARRLGKRELKLIVKS